MVYTLWIKSDKASLMVTRATPLMISFAENYVSVFIDVMHNSNHLAIHINLNFNFIANLT